MRMLRAKSAVCLIVSPQEVTDIHFSFFLLFIIVCTLLCGGEEVATFPVLPSQSAVQSLLGGGEGSAGEG